MTLAADGAGAGLHGENFRAIIARIGDFYAAPSIGALFSYLTFTDQIWFRHVVFGSAEPYWSLGFEFQYYLFFLFFSYLSGGRKILALAAWAAFVGPKILMYLPLWLMGVGTQKLLARPLAIGSKSAGALVVASIATFIAVRLALGIGVENMYQTWSLHDEIVNFIYFHAIGAAIVMNVVGASVLLKNMPPVGARLSAAIRWLAGGSFTLYLVHQPIVFMLATFIAGRSLGLSALMFVAAFVLCLALAEIAERRKAFFAGLIARYAPLLRAPGGAGLSSAAAAE